MLLRCFIIAAMSLVAVSCGGSELLSPTSTWGGDFTDRSPPTDECSGGTVTQLDTQMAVSAPLRREEIESTVPDGIRSSILDSDKFHTFHFGTDPEGSHYWGFSGYLIARGDCIVHVEITSFDN